MNLESYVEVPCELDTIIISSAASKASKVQSLFEDKVKKEKIIPPKQIQRMIIDGKTYSVFQIYVGMLDQVVMAYCIEPANANLKIHTRRFEKANVTGKALWSITKNIFGGKSRTWGMERSLLRILQSL